jgi:hypothetical protein
MKEVIAMTKLTRRAFLVNAAAAGAALALGRRPDPDAPPVFPADRVVHAHSAAATYWDYATGWYGDYVNQGLVDAMTDRGLTILTDTLTVNDAWRALIPNYSAGQKVAIKINLNNAGGCWEDGQVIDALPQPVNALVRGLKTIGVAESDILVYDVTHAWHDGGMPSRIVDNVHALFPGVQFHAYAGDTCSQSSGYSGTQFVHFNVPPGKPPISDRPICNALVQATYLINLPIMKKHGMAGVTLGFKNHFGSLDGCDQVHWSIELGDPSYTSTYSGLIDIYANTHFQGKTVLTVGDGLYGARIDNYSEVPSPWPTWGNHSPNSLFFSIDPVAIDCVMYDFLEWEGGVPAGSDDYLQLASAAGFGTFEHWDGSHQYHVIDYRRSEINLGHQLYLPIVIRNG